jgi:hypothetical protein
MKHRVLLLGFVSIILSGCARFAPPVGSGEPLDSSKSYLYGRFLQSTRGNALQFGLLVTSSRRGHEYCIRFTKDKESVCAVPVAPGEYKINKLLFIDGDDVVQDALYLSYLISNCVFSVEQGGAYYLGDYFGETSSKPTFHGPKNQWILRGICDNFTNTTQELEYKRPQFKQVDKHDSVIELLPAWLQRMCR